LQKKLPNHITFSRLQSTLIAMVAGPSRVDGGGPDELVEIGDEVFWMAITHELPKKTPVVGGFNPFEKY